MQRISFLLVLSCFAQLAFGQRISYIVSFPNLAHHEAQVELIISDIPTRTAVFRMSRSSPGRYATHEFGKNIYDVKAFDQQGKPASITRTDGDVYEVSHHNGYLRVSYTLYGNFADGTYVWLDPSGVHLNMPGAFLWMKGVDNIPITVHFNVPAEWHWNIATQLEPTNDPWTFTARSLQYFMDCPVKMGDLHFRKWEVKNPDGKTYSFRIALDGAAEDSAFTQFSGKVQKVVQQAQAVFGELPAYDNGTYTFLASINPHVQWDGMEHRNSTMISVPVTFSGQDDLLEIFSHEFFHCWNVKRIRPRTLEPFNFEKSNMSHELWFAEGFTQYYGDLLVLRSGAGSDTAYVSNTAAELINVKMNSVGARLYSPVDASHLAVFVDAGISVDKTNYPNIYSSYYPYGAALALALDLTLRERYSKTLDQYMAAAWKKFGKPEVPYTIPGLQDVLAAFTGDKKFAEDFFTRYIYGHEPIDYASLLAPAGFTLEKAAAGKAWIGNMRYSEKEGLILGSNTRKETPLYDAGLDINDKIETIDGQPVKTYAALTKLLEAHHPGETLTIAYQHLGTEKNTKVLLGESPQVALVPYERAGKPVTPAILQFRKSWLGPQH